MVRQPRRHCRGLTVCGTHPAEVEMSNLQGNGKAVIPQTFAVPERFPGELAVEPAEIEILPLEMICRYGFPVRVAD